MQDMITKLNNHSVSLLSSYIWNGIVFFSSIAAAEER